MKIIMKSEWYIDLFGVIVLKETYSSNSSGFYVCIDNAFLLHYASYLEYVEIGAVQESKKPSMNREKAQVMTVDYPDIFLRELNSGETTFILLEDCSLLLSQCYKLEINCSEDEVSPHMEFINKIFEPQNIKYV